MEFNNLVLSVLNEKQIQESTIKDWIGNWVEDHVQAVKDAKRSFQKWVKKHGGIKRTAAGMAGAAMIPTSAVTMAAYFHKFFQQHPETLTLPDKVLEQIAQFLANNPQILELLKQ